MQVLAALVAEMTALRQKAACTALGERISAVLAELQAATHHYLGQDRQRCFALLAVAYREADAVAYGLGYADLSVLATDRIRWAAGRSGDPYLVAIGDYLRVRELWSTASWDDSLYLLDGALAELEAPYAAGQDKAVAVWGAMQLRAAITAARRLDADEAYSRLQLAHEASTRLGDADRVQERCMPLL